MIAVMYFMFMVSALYHFNCLVACIKSYLILSYNVAMLYTGRIGCCTPILGPPIPTTFGNTGISVFKKSQYRYTGIDTGIVMDGIIDIWTAYERQEISSRPNSRNYCRPCARNSCKLNPLMRILLYENEIGIQFKPHSFHSQSVT